MYRHRDLAMSKLIGSCDQAMVQMNLTDLTISSVVLKQLFIGLCRNFAKGGQTSGI